VQREIQEPRIATQRAIDARRAGRRRRQPVRRCACALSAAASSGVAPKSNGAGASGSRAACVAKPRRGPGRYWADVERAARGRQQPGPLVLAPSRDSPHSASRRLPAWRLRRVSENVRV
jgi:hypothetical protein